MSNLLLITDVARLRKIFGRLTEDKNIRLRVVNNLEKGGEEITIEKPDVVFVQTHLSGLSADILIMHLKKQLGRKRSRFVLLASPSQINDAILKPYQGWLDTSAEDSRLLSDLHGLLTTLLSKQKKIDHPTLADSHPPESEPHRALTGKPAPQPEPSPVSVEKPTEVDSADTQLPVVISASPEPSLEEQGITYAPRQRLSIYSEFNSSFDSAVSSTSEPEPLASATPTLSHDWDAESIDTVESKKTGSKRITFLLWLVPVIIIVVIITYLQQKSTGTKQDAATAKATSVIIKPAPTPAAPTQIPLQTKASATPPVTPTAVVTPKVPTTVTQEQDRLSDKAVLSAIAENRHSNGQVPASSGPRHTTLPDFIPRYGYDKQFSAANPGWERYKGQVTEFKILREAKTIKAIQVIDRGGNGVPESFMKAVLRQVTKKPVLKPESSEKNDGYEIQRGQVAENIKAVYYRDENGGKLRAFVLTWQ